MDFLYGFYYNGCIHESADDLVSLHRSKEGAEKAMAEYLKENPIRYDWQVAFIDTIEIED